MNRYDILLKKPPPPVPPPKELFKYFLGVDVSCSSRDFNAIVITHMEENKIIVDFADRRCAYHMDTVIKWAEDLNRKYSVREGIADELHMAQLLGLRYVPSISSEMIFILNSNQSTIHMPKGNIGDIIKHPDLRDALIRSVWLTVKNNHPVVTPVTDTFPSFKYY